MIDRHMTANNAKTALFKNTATINFTWFTCSWRQLAMT